jgi:hypothetical protein
MRTLQRSVWRDGISVGIRHRYPLFVKSGVHLTHADSRRTQALRKFFQIAGDLQAHPDRLRSLPLSRPFQRQAGASGVEGSPAIVVSELEAKTPMHLG